MIKADQTVEYWLKCAEEDFKVMKHLYEKGDYHYSLFLGHLMLEKALKAVFVKKKNEHAPFTHSLIFLAEKSGLKLSEQQTSLLEAVNQFNIEARYPDKKFEFYKLCTKDFADSYITKIKDYYQWLLTQI
ncbi:MAG: HEPN domain-containing protein [Candidatus Margulisbacteria bacterium]|nr:HEPN domain-containing protein [Candidatus Margulisiibacteriota bacterium]